MNGITGEKSIKRNLILIVGSIGLFILLYLLIHRQDDYQQFRNYDLIAHFNEAERIGLESNPFINSGFSSPADSVASSKLINTLAWPFSNPDADIRSDNPEMLKIPSISNGAIRIKLFPPFIIKQKISIQFRKIDRNNFCTFEIVPGDKYSFRMLSMYEGVSGIISESNLELDKRMQHTFHLLFFENRIIAILDDRIISNEFSESMPDHGEVEFDPSGMDKKFRYHLKFSRLDEKVIDALEKNLISSKWGGVTFSSIPVSMQNPSKNLIYVTQNSITRRSIAMPSNSRIEFKVIIPNKTVLEGEYIALSDKGHEDDKLVLNVELLGKENKVLTARKYNSKPGNGWNRFRIDLSAFEYNNCLLKFRVENPESGKKHSDSILFLSNPSIRSYREVEDKNILLISLDTLRADHVGIYGYRHNTTPNIDKFATDSVVFKNTITQSPWTFPAHASLFTSLYPLECGAVLGNNYEQTTYSRIPDEITTLAEHFKNNGYKTFAVTGHGWVSPHFGFIQGFEQYQTVNEKSRSSSKDISYIANQCRRWISYNKDFKWFIFLHSFEIHAPYMRRIFKAEEKDGKAAGIIANYDSGLFFADYHIGRVLEHLKKEGLLTNTLVIITSDHGESFYDKETGEPETENAGRHGHNLYEEQLHIPLIIGGPDDLPEGIRIINQVRLIDILPTVLDYTDVDIPQDIRGISLLPLIKGVSSDLRMAYSEAVKTTANNEMKSLRTSDYKLIVNSNAKRPRGVYELYSMKKDKGEALNIADKEGNIRDTFSNKIEQIIKSIVSRRKMYKQYRTGAGLDSDLLEQLKALGYIGAADDQK